MVSENSTMMSTAQNNKDNIAAVMKEYHQGAINGSASHQ
jgi:hypothetical protein